MNSLNNSHLIAGFFRYHREKLNYSLRGLVGDGSVVDLSSLSAFENGEKILTDSQLIWLFGRISYDYYEVINKYKFDKEYNLIYESICLGETNNAEKLYIKCEEYNVFDSLGCINFCLLKYLLSNINSKRISSDSSCLMFEKLYSSTQKSLLKIAQAYESKFHGNFTYSIELLKDADRLTYNPKIRAWILQQLGIYYAMLGNYAEATIALLEAKTRYSEFLGFICLIQINLNLGSIYVSTNSINKAEESYRDAYHQAMLLKESTYLLTKCFNSLCWLYFETNQYDKVDELLSNKPEELVESRNTYFILAWAYYKLGKNDEAIQYCREGLEKFSKYTYVCMIYEYIEKACKGIKTGQDALLRKIIETEDYDHDALTEKLFTYELIDIYERRKNYEKAFKYAKKLLNR